MRPKDALGEIDIPPLWLGLFAGLGWAVGQVAPVALPYGRGAGLALIGLGLALMAVAAAQMVAHRTSFVPRRRPERLVSGGVFALSRNPIYLGDALVLAGALLWWQAVLAAPLVPAFMALITRRFIRGEERWIAAAYGAEYAAYRARVRRWL